MNEQEIEREQVKCVFGLCGGELADLPIADFPDAFDQFTYWYEGAPEWLEHDLADRWDREYRTVVACLLYGDAPSCEGWELISSHTTSGEAECWWCGDHTGNESERDGCELCEGEGLVYLGEGWAECVMRRLPTAEEIPDAAAEWQENG